MRTLALFFLWIVLVFTSTEAPGHDELVSAERPVAVVSASKGDLAKSTIFRAFTPGDPNLRKNSHYDFAFNTCAAKGARLANIEEVKEIVAAKRHEPRAKDAPCFWSSTRAQSKIGTRFYQVFDKDRPTRTEESEFTGCAALCVSNPNALKDISEMCPVGRMPYCTSQKQDPKAKANEYRFMCGDFSMALESCLRLRLGMDSWFVNAYCKDNNRVVWRRKAGGQGHATTLVQVPLDKNNDGFGSYSWLRDSAKGPQNGYCILEPQHVAPPGPPRHCCWRQSPGKAPVVPPQCAHVAIRCDDPKFPNATVTVSVTAREGLRNLANRDLYFSEPYCDNERCMSDFSRLTGIPKGFLREKELILPRN